MSSTSKFFGVDVVTAETLTGRDFVEEAQALRRPGVRGVIVGESNSHGQCYKVRHSSDGTETYYDPDELFEIGRRIDNL